jgi:hypothetical protein
MMWWMCLSAVRAIHTFTSGKRNNLENLGYLQFRNSRRDAGAAVEAHPDGFGD